jgi:hypothetical protein
LRSNTNSINLESVAEFGTRELTELRRGITELIEAIEGGRIRSLDPHERLDLWQYLQAVRSRLILVEQALARDALAKPRPDADPVDGPESTAACG